MTDYFLGADTIIFVVEHYVFFARSLAVMFFFLLFFTWHVFFCFTGQINSPILCTTRDGSVRILCSLPFTLI